MSALPSPLQNQANAAADPSMEEILASIRRIIADDHGTPIDPRPSRMTAAAEAAAPIAANAKPVTASRADLPRMRSAPEAPSLRAGNDEGASAAPVAEAPPPVSIVEPVGNGVVERLARLEASPARSRPVLRHSFDDSPQPQLHAEPRRSPAGEPVKPRETEAAPGEASGGNALADTLLSPLAQASVSSAFEALTVSMAAQNASVVEGAVRDMLRPMLKEWLDENLPTIVERLVRAEIERVARGGRS